MIIAIAGATGVVGRHVAAAARMRGHAVVPLARSLGVDLTTGTGLDQALSGTDAVIDTTSVVTQKTTEAEEFFESVTRTLLHAEHSAGVGHHVVLSIVGIDDLPVGHYAGKLAQERLVTEGRTPWSILRATQLHEFAAQALDFMTLGPFSLIPQMASQTVAAAEVAERLVDLAEVGPSGRVPDVAGPEANQIVDLARRVSSHRALGRRVIAIPVPGVAGKAMRSGALRPSVSGATGTLTFEEWLRGT